MSIVIRMQPFQWCLVKSLAKTNAKVLCQIQWCGSVVVAVAAHHLKWNKFGMHSNKFVCVFFSLRSQSNAHHTTNLTRIFSCFVSFYLSFFVVFRSACEVHLYLSAAFYYGTILWNLYNLFASIMLQTQTLANALSAFKRRFRKLTTKRRTRKAHKRNAYIVYTTVYIVLLLSLSLSVYKIYKQARRVSVRFILQNVYDLLQS